MSQIINLVNEKIKTSLFGISQIRQVVVIIIVVVFFF